MTIPQLHMYDLKTGEYTGSRDATQRPSGEYILEATGATPVALPARSEEHTSELQSPEANSYAVFCLKKKISI